MSKIIDQKTHPLFPSSSVLSTVPGFGKAVGFNITLNELIPRNRLHPIYGSFPRVLVDDQTTPLKPPLLAEVEDSVWQTFWKSITTQMNFTNRCYKIFLVMTFLSISICFLPHRDDSFVVFVPAAILVVVLLFTASCIDPLRGMEATVQKFKGSFAKHGVHVELVKHEDIYGEDVTRSEYIVFTDMASTTRGW